MSTDKLTLPKDAMRHHTRVMFAAPAPTNGLSDQSMPLVEIDAPFPRSNRLLGPVALLFVNRLLVLDSVPMYEA